MMAPKINNSTDICIEITITSQLIDIVTYEGEEPFRQGKQNLTTLRMRQVLNASDYLKIGDDRFRHAVEMVLEKMLHEIKTKPSFYLSGE